MTRAARKTVTIVTPPEGDPVTLAQAKAWARIDTSDDDATVTALITAAHYAACEYLRRALITTTFMLTHDLHGNDLYDSLPAGTYDLPLLALYGAMPPSVELPKGPVAAITGVTTYFIDSTSAAYDPSNYFLDTGGDRLVLNFGCIWPPNLRPRHAVEITYTAGYGASASNVPPPILQGMMIHVASMYEQRGLSADAMSIPPGALALYNKYRIVGERRG